MWRRFRLLFFAVLLACGSGDPSSGFTDGGGDALLDQAAAFTLRVEPLSLTETVTLGAPPPAFGVSQGRLWVTAVDLSEMKAGNVDPSATAFWIPGQNINAQYVRPQWTKAVLAPPN